MSELKPCPFCGGPATFCTSLSSTGDYDAAVICERCNAKTDFMRATDEEDAKVMAAACWNTRAERTCRPLRKSGKEFDSEERLSSLVALCSECLGYLGEAQDVFLGSVAFCSSCGARVVVE